MPCVSSRRRSRIGRPYRRVRRWARHTPNGRIALNMIAAGITLILVAVVLAVIVF
jgi:DNA-binding CsgD family transcriptional regulator